MAADGSVDFSSLFSPREVRARMEPSERDPAIHALLELLAYQRGIGNVDDVYAAVLERENDVSTVIAPGIALPHARLDTVDELVIAVGTSEEGVAWEEGKPPVRLIILMLVPKGSPALYLQAMSSLAKICEDPETADQVGALEKSEDVWRFFERGGMVLPDHVCAGDIMSKDTVVLQESDTLEHAIDMFIRHDLVEVPVIDKDGDLAGVVSADELLRVCLPDYILWMEDLSPILNFEPFAEILRNESSTWLAEIMSDDFGIVDDDAPAIEVAKEMARHDAEQVFVVRGERLVGVITLQQFLNKILRE